MGKWVAHAPLDMGAVTGANKQIIRVADAVLADDVPAFHQIAAYSAPVGATYITQTPNAALTNEQALSLLATGLMKNTTATGVISIATADVDYQVPLTFASGLTRTVNTVTGDYITGKAGGQTWTSGTASADPLVVRATSHATMGQMTFQALPVVVQNAETAHPSAMFVLDNTSPTGQITMWLKANGTLRGGLRSDYAGNLTWFARGGIHEFYTGGDFGEGTMRMAIATSGVVTVTNLAGITAEMVKVSTTGALQRAAAGVDYVFPGTVAPIDAQYLVLATNATLTNERTFTPSSGLTVVDGGASSTYTITNDVLTGKTTGQTFYGGVNASATLAIHSTASGTKGAMTLAASQFLLSNAESGFPAATLILDNTSASGQMAIWAKAAGTLYGGIRIDYGGNFHAFAKGGAFNIWTGGDADTGTTRISVAAAGAVTIADLAGGTAVLVKTSTAGLLQRSTPGTDYVVPGTEAPVGATYLTLTTNASLTNERVFTTSTGLTAVDGGAGGNYTITNDVVTAVAGSATWTGSNNALNLTIKANTAASGNLTLTATGFLLSNAQTTYTTPTLTFDNTSASGQDVIHFKTNGTLRGGIRADFGGSMIWFSGAGTHQFYTGGDFAAGTERMNISNAGLVTIADLAGGTAVLVKTSTAGVLQRGVAGTDYVVPGTVAPLDATYLTLTTNATLTNERTFLNSTGISATDGGAGGNFTITNDVVTGITGSATWSGSSNANNLTIKANTAGSGNMTFTATGLFVSNAQTTYTTPTLTFDNTSATGQIAVHFKTNGTLRGVIRGDYGGNMVWVAGAGGHQWYTGGDFATGTQRMDMTNAGAVTIVDLGGGSAAIVKASTAGLLSRATAGTDYTGIITLTAGNGMTGGGTTAANRTFDVAASDATITVGSDSIAVGTINTANINNDQVTYAKIQNVTANRLMGREVSGAGDMEEIAIGTNLSLSGTTLNATTFADVAATFLTLSTSSGLSNERVFTPAQGLNAVDGGAGSTYTISNNVFTGEAGSPTWNGSNNANNLTIRANTAATGSISLTATQVAFGSYVTINDASPTSEMYLGGAPIGSRDRIRFQLGGVTITSTSDILYFRVQPLNTTLNANITYATSFFVDSHTATISSGKTVTNLVGTLLRAPVATGSGTATNVYALYVLDGLSRFVGDGGGYVFEFPSDTSGSQGFAYAGRIKCVIAGVTRWLYYFED